MTTEQQGVAQKTSAKVSLSSQASDPFTISTSIEPVKVGLFYHVGLVAAALVMLILPLIYLAMIAAVAWLTFLYAINSGQVLSHVRGIFGLVVFLGPLLIGGVLLIFMIKPLFSRPKNNFAPLTLYVSEQQKLYTFVYQICDAMGAPRPSRIDVDCQVNASAGFKNGLLGLLTGKMVLTLGLPLIAGMSAQSMAGVLAHEFGHFAQGTGLRLTYLVRHINYWFARMVYERNSFDQQLANASRDGGFWAIMLIAALARFAIWISRCGLWLLMMTGQIVCSFLLREMEFDADRYGTRIAGSKCFAETLEHLAMLTVSQNAAFHDLNQAWREKHLCDSLPKLICMRESSMPDKIRVQIREQLQKIKTGKFDTHPCDRDRIASILKEDAPGVFHSDKPAADLFEKFDELSKVVTMKFYKLNLGDEFKPSHMVPTENVVSQNRQVESNIENLNRFFAGVLRPARPIFPSVISIENHSRDDIANEISSARIRLNEINQAILGADKIYSELEDRKHILWRAQILRAAQLIPAKIPLGKMGLKNGPVQTDDAGLDKLVQEVTSQQETQWKIISESFDCALTRINFALASRARDLKLQNQPATDTGGEYSLSDDPEQDPTGRILTALRTIQNVMPQLERNRRDLIALGTLLNLVKPENNPPQMVSMIQTICKRLHSELMKTHETLRTAPYPYEHSERGATLSRFALEKFPGQEDIGGIFNATQATIDAVFDLYARMMGDLARHCEAYEKTLGLEPLILDVKCNEEPPAQTAA